MATLADSFLQDLVDLEDDLEVEEDADERVGDTAGSRLPDAPEVAINSLGNSQRDSQRTLLSLKVAADSSEDDYDEEIPCAIALYEKSQVETLAIVSNLSQQTSFRDTMAEVRALTEREPELVTAQATHSFEGGGSGGAQPAAVAAPCSFGASAPPSGALEPHEYALVEKSNQLIAKLDIEILNIHSFIRDVYSKKFPELESIVFSPLEYIAVVQRIKNETDLTVIELSDILPSTVTMAVTVAASMTTGQPLPLADLEKVLRAASEAMHLADCRKDVLAFLESRMGVLAPNVSAIIGTALAARLITHAGGVTSLARMPAQNIMLVGSSAASLRAAGGGALGVGVPAPGATGGATSATRSVIYGCDIIQSTPLAFRNRALKLVSGKVGLAARVDAFREAQNGAVGRALREKIVRGLIKAQEPPPAPLKKALPIPDDAPKSRRGGKRHRRSKEKYGLSEFRKHANRLAFGPEAEEEVGQDSEGGGGGLGMVTKSGFGHGKLRLQAKQQKVQVRRQRRQHRATPSGASTAAAPSSGATGGMSSSLAFTPVQGIELCNPETMANQTGRRSASRCIEQLPQREDYFSSAVTFSKS